MVPLMSEEERNTAMGQVRWLDCSAIVQKQAQQMEMDLQRLLPWDLQRSPVPQKHLPHPPRFLTSAEI